MLDSAPYPIRSKRMVDNLDLDESLDKDDSVELVSKRLSNDVAQLIALKKASRLVKRNIDQALELLDENYDYDSQSSAAQERSVMNRNMDSDSSDDTDTDDDVSANEGPTAGGSKQVGDKKAQSRSLLSRHPDTDASHEFDSADEASPVARSLEPVAAEKTEKAEGLKQKSLERAVASKQVASVDSSQNRSASASSWWVYVPAGVGILALISAAALGAFLAYQWIDARITGAVGSPGSSAVSSPASKKVDQSDTVTQTAGAEQV